MGGRMEIANTSLLGEYAAGGVMKDWIKSFHFLKNRLGSGSGGTSEEDSVGKPATSMFSIKKSTTYSPKGELISKSTSPLSVEEKV
ncbi:hypothetical protein Tco_0382748 [Tanacetum coccineum]